MALLYFFDSKTKPSSEVDYGISCRYFYGAFYEGGGDFSRRAIKQAWKV